MQLTLPLSSTMAAFPSRINTSETLPKDDTEVIRHAHAVLPVHGVVREEFSPLLYHLFAAYVASYVAERLGRSLFQSDRPDLLRSVNEYYASLQQKDSQPSRRKLR